MTKAQAWPADKVERRKVADLIPYARNSRTHSEAQIAQIAASIKEWGWTTPVLIGEDGGIIAGHGRVMAAQKLGIEEVPCIVATGWTDAQRRAYVIADNRLPELAGWDQEMLALELAELGELDFDLSLTGFDGTGLGIGVEQLDEMPSLPIDDKAPFQQMTFTVHDSQAEQIVNAIKIAKAMGPFVDSQNENGNGNALSRICETFITEHGIR